MEQLDIKSLYEEELKEKMISLGEKPFKGKQLYQWLHQKAAGSYEEMTNLSEGLRKKLTEQEPLTHLEVVEVQTSKIDGTQKYLFQLADGNVIESVWMQYKHGNSVCISSQVGCRMGCRFLCIHDRWIDQKPSAVRDAGSGLPDPGTDRGACVECGCDGNRRAIG